MSGRESFTSLGVYAGTSTEVRCSTYPDQGPILAVDAGRVTVNLAVAGRDEMPAWGVQFARELAREAQRFAAECERIHAAHSGQDTGGAPKDPAA